jgi:hypothetical protein
VKPLALILILYTLILCGSSVGAPLGMRRCWGYNLVQNVHISPSELWDPTLQTNTVSEFEEMISFLLDSIGNVLERIARLESQPPHPYNPLGGPAGPPLELPGHEAFAKPIGLHVPSCTCMLIDNSKVSIGRHYQRGRQKHISQPRSDLGYATLKLGKVPPGEGHWLTARAHQVVAWAMWGPPTHIDNPVVFHWCNNSTCLNPDHLVFGECWANRKGGEVAQLFAELEMVRTGRLIPQ